MKFFSLRKIHWLATILVLQTGGTFLRAQTNDVAIAPPLKVADQFLIAIPKDGFGKDYLFSASLIPQAEAATSKGLAGKIVRFELFPDGVDMYESTKGLVVTHDLPARRLLASFPIVRQDGGDVIVDFNKGMRKVFTQSWTAGGNTLDMDAHDSTLEIPESRVFAVQKDGDQLVIRQSVQTRDLEENQDVERQYEVRYFLTPYQPGNFAGKEPDNVNDRYVRFFETEGRIEPGTGRVSTRIARYDLTQPVQYYYSANTPPDYVQAVKDGILYWNTVFGKEVVKASEAPAGLTAPDAEHNIVQWVPWDKAGFAYADLLVDPLTGESEHGQIYMTSAFTFVGEARARALLRAFEEIAAPKTDGKKSAKNLGVPFLASAELCKDDPQAFAAQMADGLQAMLAVGPLSDATALRASQDMVREVVAHEVGHTFGLRHNFAASLDGTMTSKELDDWFHAYLAGEPLDAYTNKITATSVMDYDIFQARVFSGWRIRTVKKPLPYDHAAIMWGYFNSSEARTNKVLFATDDDVGVYGDVLLFDYGRDPVISGYNDTADIMNRLPNSIIETFIAARAPQNTNDRVPLDQVNLNVSGIAGKLGGELASQLQWFNASTRSFKVESGFNYIGELNRKARYEAHWKYLNTQIEQLGGVDRALFSDLPDNFKLDLPDAPAGQEIIPRLSVSNLTAKLEQLLNSTNYQTFVGLDNKTYSFTDDDRALILSRGKKFFGQLSKVLVKQMCLRLADAPRNLGVEAGDGTVSEDDITAKLEKRIIEIAKYIIMAQNETNRISGKMDKGYVEVPDFQYDQETRLLAAKMLNSKSGSFAGWADDAKSDLNKQLKTQIEDSLNISHFKDFNVALLSRPLRDWYQQQQDILALLPPAK
jgi:hypothetical protein